MSRETIPDGQRIQTVTKAMEEGFVVAEEDKADTRVGHCSPGAFNICEQGFMDQLPQEGTDPFIPFPFPNVTQLCIISIGSGI